MIIKCYNCFNDYNDSYEKCPKCGHEPGSVKREANHLPRGGVLIDRYIIGEVCGFGGFGITYKAWDMQLETIVAIKEYFPNGSVNRIPGTENVVLFSGNRLKEFNYGLTRFIEEAKTTAKYVSHKNIVNVLNYFEANKTAYIVMEFLDGTTLENYLQQSSDGSEKIDIDTAVDIALSICNALKTIHVDGVIHRDVSPDNIFMCLNGSYKLYDFGAARFSQDENRLLTIILKPGYAPPEQYEKVNTQGPWTDIYALGATLYKMVTGVKPVESMNRKISDDLKDPIELDPTIPQYLNDAIMKAMAVEQHLRFQKIEDFEVVLKKEKTVEAVKVTIKKKKRKRLLGICTVATLILTGSGIFGYRWHRQREEKTLPAESIDVWYISDNNDLPYALSEIKDEFCKNYEGVSINFVAIKSADYQKRLNEAMEAGNMPPLLQSDTIDTISYNILSLKPTIDNLNLEEYYFLSDYQVQILTENKMPMGFNVPLFYMNTTLTDFSGNSVAEISQITNTDTKIVVSDNVKDEFNNLYGSSESYTQDAMEQFCSGDIAYLFSDTTSFYSVQSALPARFKMLTVNSNEIECTFTNCWSLGDCGDAKQEKVAARFLEFMLSDYAQDYFYIRYKTPALPVNKNALEVYKDVYSEFETVITPSDHYVFELN